MLDRDYNEVLRAAGRRFMLRAAAGTHGLYDACNGVAALRHEGDEGVGTDAGLRAATTRPWCRCSPSNRPIPLRDHRRIRKLLELSEDRTALITDATDVFRAGLPGGARRPAVRALVYGAFHASHYSWELSHNEQLMMKVVSNTPRLPQGTIDADNFTRAVQRVFPAAWTTPVWPTSGN